jgi:hypothetical protein
VVDTIPNTIVAPADSGAGYLYGPEQTVVVNPDCDSLRVAQEMLRRAMRDVVGQAETYRLEIDGELEGRGRTINELRQQVDRFRAKLAAQVNEPPKPVQVPKEIIAKVEALSKENAELKENQETHTFFWFLGAGLSVFAAGVLFAFLAPFLGRLRGLVG